MPARPQRSANSDFAGPRRRLAEQQGRCICTGDQKHYAHGAQQEIEREANVAYHFIPHARYGDAPALVALRILLLETPGNRGHLGLGLFERYACFQPAYGEPALPSTASGRPDGRNPNVSIVGEAETGRQHTGDRARPGCTNRLA